MTEAVVRTPLQGCLVSVVGDVYRFLTTGAETSGRYALIEALVPPGGGPPPHVHSREDEGFYILEGEVTFQIGDQRLVATAGTFAKVPIGTLHTFKNASDRPARMLVLLAPAGLEEMFFEVGTPIAAGTAPAPHTTPDEIAKLLSVAMKYGVEIRLPNS